MVKLARPGGKTHWNKSFCGPLSFLSARQPQFGVEACQHQREPLLVDLLRRHSRHTCTPPRTVMARNTNCKSGVTPDICCGKPKKKLDQTEVIFFQDSNQSLPPEFATSNLMPTKCLGPEQWNKGFKVFVFFCSRFGILFWLSFLVPFALYLQQLESVILHGQRKFRRETPSYGLAQGLTGQRSLCPVGTCIKKSWSHILTSLKIIVSSWHLC